MTKIIKTINQVYRPYIDIVIVSGMFLLILTGHGKQTFAQKFVTGAAQTNSYFPLLEKHNHIGLVVNHTSVVKTTHLVDTLLKSGIKVLQIFAPEHGYRGNADAGKPILNGVDSTTGIRIVSLYGSKYKPTQQDIKEIDIIVYDIQDVGVRFFTYISTLHYIMEVCAENGIPLIILDRPNPNGDYVDGPVLDLKFKSFIGIHPIPIVYGMTPGELARFIVGEKLLKSDKVLDLIIIPLVNYKHSDPVFLSINPSPNLQNYKSIRLYPSLCLFEATSVSIGRGTDYPFQVIGYSDQKFGEFCFKPESKPGIATHPPLEDTTCWGSDLRDLDSIPKFSLSYFIDFMNKSGLKESFFKRPAFFDKLAGNDNLRKQLIAGKTEKEIRESWQPALTRYREIRLKYLLYP